MKHLAIIVIAMQVIFISCNKEDDIIENKQDVIIEKMEPGYFVLTELKNYVGGEAYSTGGWISSDEVYKKNIQAVDGNEVVEKLMKIEGKKYEFKNESELGDILKNDTLGLIPHFPSGEH